MPLQKKLYIFEGLQFLLLPRGNTYVNYHRKNLARNCGAIVNRNFVRGGTTHILIDRANIKTESQLIRALKQERFTTPFDGVKLLSQTWLTDSLEERKILQTEPYELKVDHDALESETVSSKGRSSRVLGNGIEFVKDLKDRNATKEILKAKRAGDPLEQERALKHSKRVDQFEDILREKNNLDNPNGRTITILSRMADEMILQGEAFKARSYRNAIGSLSKTPAYICTIKDAKGLSGIGDSIAKKIEEIAKTDKLAALDDIEESQESKLLKLFLGIHSVGPITARKWIKEGMKTLKDISKRKDVTINQKLGIKYYKDWNVKIPRNECTLHQEYIEKLFRKIDPKVELTIGGSYRRGALECGDVDFIVTKPDAEMQELNEILVRASDEMTKSGYIKCQLTKPTRKLLGGCALPSEYMTRLNPKHKVGTWGKCRRVDFLLVPRREMGAALVYFTGNNYFNRKLRLLASKKNMRLNEAGLFKKITYIQSGNVKEREMLIESFNERKIFKLLGVEYLEPTARNFGHEDKFIKL